MSSGGIDNKLHLRVSRFLDLVQCITYKLHFVAVAWTKFSTLGKGELEDNPHNLFIMRLETFERKISILISPRTVLGSVRES